MNKFIPFLAIFFSKLLYAQSPLLIDINAGSGSSSPVVIGTLNSQLILATSINNGEIYKSDGTSTGTQLIKKVDNYISSSGSDEQCATVNGKIVFEAIDITGDIEPWVTDGTTIGTARLKDLVTGSSSYPRDFISAGNKVIFAAYESNPRMTGIWTTDGTTTGTSLLNVHYDIFNNNNSFAPNEFKELNGKVYYLACDTVDRPDIWVTDGTAAGTHFFLRVPKNYSPSNPPSYLFKFGNSLYQYCYVDTNSSGGGSINDFVGSIWKIDVNNSTATFITLLKGFQSLTNTSNLFYFNNYDAGGSVSELWVSDGTSSGTKKLSNVSPGIGVEFKNKMYFVGYDNELGLWSTDGTVSGTSKFKSFSPTEDFASELIVFNNKIYFFTNNASTNTSILWQSDGTLGGTIQITSNFAETIWPRFTIFNGSLYFTAATSNSGLELWKLSTTTSDIHYNSPVTTSLSCYPNPAQTKLNLTISALEGNTGYQIFNLLGDKILEGQMQDKTTTINIADLPQGVYVIRVKNGLSEKTQKFSVE